MKLLFDQNPSPRLSRLLADIYPDCVHVRDGGLHDADDLTIWDYARDHGYVIVSKDSDFQQRSWRTSQIHLVESRKLYSSQD